MEIISVAELKIGMFFAEPDCAWTEFPFALQGFVLTTPQQIELIREKCRFVYVDRSRSLGEHYAAPKIAFDRALRPPLFTRKPSDEEIPPRRRRFLDFLHHQETEHEGADLGRELIHIEPKFNDLQAALRTSFQNVLSEKRIDLSNIREGVRDMAGSLKRNPDALMWLLRLKRVDRYSFDHAMDVSVYLLLLGTHIGWQGNKLLQLGLAGMLQDVGKINLPPELLSKTDPLSEGEKILVRSHVASSLEILGTQSEIPQEVILTIARHHERWDGSGYPRGLMLDQIGIEAEMAGLVDSFCAMLRNKPYRNALGHQEALEELYALRDHKFNPNLMEQFVQCVGLYPIGTLVELSSGEVGVVIQQNRVHRSRPRVLLMLDKHKNKVVGYQVIDLREPAHKALRVVRALPHDAYGIAEDDYYLG
ncbi:DUF3391 domain-containing protein [Dechloromonas sp. TW-R-39-2]|uniref:HD-GYP domain-containing protein n=1 Tax=Dechloromonas sp. TW-R-39-2 TaxID=2654218 RepID=UPI00193D3DD1|nr:HD-GYP domain-containing protein [Dechloromonas sp. TW-R-39-2]QRM20884.1 DUF3391 domain-containing protein [Dechloromonas sp. TW-R-39-2]